MKCWECKHEITKARLIPYIWGDREGDECFRDICESCLPKLPRDQCGFVRVKSRYAKITRGGNRMNQQAIGLDEMAEAAHQEYLDALERATPEQLSEANRAVAEHLSEYGCSFHAVLVEIVNRG